VAEGRVTSDDYQARQRPLFDELTGNALTWRVTDFITLGSPLAHATLLLARNPQDLRDKQAAREFPTCPPVLEKGRFSYPPDESRRTPHHAAVFGPTRWTNLYFPACCVIKGDLIGGRLAPLFGDGVRDVAVSTSRRLGLASHTLYWTPESEKRPGSHIEALRDALDLLDARPEETVESDEGS
jgi:hypothetical protein